MGLETPPFVIPDHGQYLWDWFSNLNSAVSRIRDGVCRLIPPSEYFAHFKMSGLLVSPEEYATLQAMDKAYCEETNKELRSLQAKREEEQRQAVADAKSKAGKGRRR